MALRSLENRLNSIRDDEEERPRKVMKKLITPISKPVSSDHQHLQSDADFSDNVSVDYVESARLEPLEQPEVKITTLMEELESKDWSSLCEALNDVRRFALHHSSLLLPLLYKVFLAMVKSMKNPRSALCKTSIMASTDIFSSFGHALPPTNADEAAAFNQLLLQLLIKASQDKKFVCDEAEKALDKMACCALPVPLLGKLQSYVKHTNHRVRAKAAVSISTCVSKMGYATMKEYGITDLLQIAAQLLNDRLPEARESARNIANTVYQAFASSDDSEFKDPSSSVSESWQNFCMVNLQPSGAQSIVKITSQQ